MNRVGVVAGREFLSTVKRKSYLIVTFGMPFFAAIYFGAVGFLPALFMAQSGAIKKDVGLVDLAGVVRLDQADSIEDRGAAALKQAGEIAGRLAPRGAGAATAFLEQVTARVHFRPFGSRDEALAALRKGDIERFYLIPSDYVARGGVESYQPADAPLNVGRARAREALESLLGRSLLTGRIPDGMIARIEAPIVQEASESFVLREDGSVGPFDRTSRVARLAIPGVFGILLLMSLMTSAGYLLQGVSEEKENRVIEVILSSVRPDQLLFGKLLGLGAAGLLQLAVWVSVATMATSLLAAAALAFLDFKLFAGCLIFFVLGYLMIGSLMTGTGALGSNARETQQFAAIWSLITVLPPALTWIAIFDQPNGWIARGLGWFPLTAPITMMLRLGTGQVPLWDFLVAVIALAAGVYLAIRTSGALFRLGLLMYGKRPTLREILRQVRNAW
jgi:ABC-2 type transport system permease protein